MLHVKTISNSLLVVGDVVSKQDQVGSILDGLSEEYNSFVMQMYGMSGPPTLYDVEALLYAQEAQLAKFSQELAVATATANIAHTMIKQLVCVAIGANSRSRTYLSRQLTRMIVVPPLAHTFSLV